MCEDLVGTNVRLTPKAEAEIYCLVLACDSLTIMVTTIEPPDPNARWSANSHWGRSRNPKSTAPQDTLTYALQSVSISTKTIQVDGLAIAMVVTVVVGVLLVWAFLTALDDQGPILEGGFD